MRNDIIQTTKEAHLSVDMPTVSDNDNKVNNTHLGFAELGLATPILQALTQSGYTTPTPIQSQAIPPSLAGRDLLLSAQTGSGKTAAFVLPILHKIATSGDNKSVRAVILTPTRELAMQVQDNVRKYSGRLKGVFSVPLVGGTSYTGQLRALKKGVQIIVATPGRFIDHLNAGRIDLSKLDVLVLDEADRMLDMGFSEDITHILSATPANRQTIMSSATWAGAVGKIAESFTKNPARIAIKIETAHIDEKVYFCDDFRHKNAILGELLNDQAITQAIIFASTKMSSEKLAQDLQDKGYKAHYLHGDLPQGKRNRIVSDVKAGKCQFLVATDVAARGLDISTISHVINYDLPRQAEDYVHRIGRSGRAGRTGQAINLCSFDDYVQWLAIGRYLNRSMDVASVEGLLPKRNFADEQASKHKNGRKGRHVKRGGVASRAGSTGVAGSAYNDGRSGHGANFSKKRSLHSRHDRCAFERSGDGQSFAEKRPVNERNKTGEKRSFVSNSEKRSDRFFNEKPSFERGSIKKKAQGKTFDTPKSTFNPNEQGFAARKRQQAQKNGSNNARRFGSDEGSYSR